MSTERMFTSELVDIVGVEEVDQILMIIVALVYCRHYHYLC